MIITDNLIDHYSVFLANSAIIELPACCTEPALYFLNSCTLVHTLLWQKNKPVVIMAFSHTMVESSKSELLIVVLLFCFGTFER